MSEFDEIKTYEQFKERFQYDPRTSRIGNGGHCDVFRAYDDYLGRYIAIKVSKVDFADENRSLKEETERVRQLPKHKNIARYEKCYRFNIAELEYDYAILEYYENGNLLKFNKNMSSDSKQKLSVAEKLSILEGILEGIHFLHSNKIIHRDLKPENVLIFLDKNEGKFIPKITDFETSKNVAANEPSIKMATPFYSSPEQLKEDYTTYNADLWSFGITALVFLNALSEGDKEALKQIKQGKLPPIDFLPQAWQNLIKKCLKEEANERIKSCDECFEILAGNKNELSKKDPIIEDPTDHPTIEIVSKKRKYIIPFFIFILATAFFIFWKMQPINKQNPEIFSVESVKDSLIAELETEKKPLTEPETNIVVQPPPLMEQKTPVAPQAPQTNVEDKKPMLLKENNINMSAENAVGQILPDRQDESVPATNALTDGESVVINGVRWATRNVASPGAFAATPTDAGKFYRWNHKTAWTTSEEPSNWDSNTPVAATWEKSNDPSPAGWRLPTVAEIDKLIDINKVTNEWTNINGVSGRKFTDKASGNSLFLPAAGRCDNSFMRNVARNGYYWSNTLFENNSKAFYLGFGISNAGIHNFDRNNWFNIRSVAE